MITTRQRAGLFAALVLMTAGGTANAQGDTSMLKFAERENCMSCHSVSRTFMGPSFHSIAAKYANVEGAHRQLARKIAEGGVGVWGQVPMPANTQLTPSQALALADWILSLH